MPFGPRSATASTSTQPSRGHAIRSTFAGGEGERKSSPPGLTGREIDVLRLTARGQTNKEIAQYLQLSVKTVETFKSRAMAKCGLKSRAEIVRYVVMQGWFDAIQ